MGTISHNDGIAVDFSDTQRKLLLAGGHEQSNTLYKSTDGGQNWTNIGAPGSGYSSYPYIVNTQTYLMGVQSGMYRSVDAGSTWAQVCATAPGTHITQTSAGDLYYVGGGKLVKGSSDGLTWTVLSSSFTAFAAPVIELPGGKIAVMSQTGSGISISTDKGVTWKTVCHPLPTQVANPTNGGTTGTFTYNAVAGAFYTYYWNCSFTAPVTLKSDQIWRYDTMITAGTAVITPFRSAPAFIRTSMADGSNDVPVYNLDGRIVRSITGKEQTMRTGEICLLKTSSGVVVRQAYGKF